MITQSLNNTESLDANQLQPSPLSNLTNLNDYNLFLDGILSEYGYDFKQYTSNMLHRRLHHLKGLLKVDRLSDLVPIQSDDHQVFKQLLNVLSISITEFFREPLVYLEIRNQIIPALKTYPFVNIWCAGCSTGEEAYSLAILLAEHDLLDRCFIYATDMNDKSLAHARSGEYSAETMKVAIKNFSLFGKANLLQSYFDYQNDTYNIKRFLKDRIIFSNHNLLDDGVFAEINLITCRNVMMYFNKKLKKKCLALFSDSLIKYGFLSLGSKESITYIDSKKNFELLDKKGNLYRKNSA